MGEFRMIDEMLAKMSWLGEPDVTLVSDDGHKILCHQSILGIYDKNLRSILSHYKMNEHELIFEQTSHFELDNYVKELYSSLDKLIFHVPDEVENPGQIEFFASKPKFEKFKSN